jgi:hypothetical protein
MDQLNTEEQRIPATVFEDIMGWQKFAWTWAQVLLLLVSTIQHVAVGMLLMILILLRASRYWIQLDEDKKRLERYYVISSTILVLMSLRIIFFGLGQN